MNTLTQPLRDEHKELFPNVERIRQVAELIGDAPLADIRQGVEEVYDFLANHLKPHAEAEDAALYPVVQQVLGNGLHKQAVQAYLAFLSSGSSLYPLDTLKLAGVDFTYNDPVVWIEYVHDVCAVFKEAGLYTAFITAAYRSLDVGRPVEIPAFAEAAVPCRS